MAEPAEARRGRVFTLAPHRPFLDALAEAIIAGDLPRPGGTAPALLDLPLTTILLPTRRAARALQEAFLRQTRERALLLPAIRPIATEADEAGLVGQMLASRDPGLATLPPQSPRSNGS